MPSCRAALHFLMLLLPAAVGWQGHRAAGGAAPPPRDPARWPFEARSPWNQPIGSGARYVAIQSPRCRTDGGACLNCTEWSHPIYIASPGDPVRALFEQQDASAPPRLTLRMRVPAAARPDPEEDGHLHLIDEERRFVVETFQARVRPDGSVLAANVVRNDLRGPGIYPEWHGTRAYGGSAIGGLIRTGELAGGIPHALAVAVDPGALNQHGPRGKLYVWPACAPDPEDPAMYSTSGNLHMGSLLAIPASVDVRRIGVGTSGPAFEVARALQDYGAYIVDSGGGNVIFYAEPAAASEVRPDFDEALGRVVRHLQVVANNGPRSIGGGGSARRPFAPPFAD